MNPNEKSNPPGECDWAMETPEAVFEEGQVYRAKIVDIVWENSRKNPGTQYPRFKFIAFDGHGWTKAVSCIP